MMVIRGVLRPAGVLISAVHEGGHALAFVLNPNLTGINLESASLAESQAYAFESAWDRTVVEFRGQSTLRYAKSPANMTFISDEVKRLEEQLKAPLSLSTRHDVGGVLLWLRASEQGQLKQGQPLSATET